MKPHRNTRGALVWALVVVGCGGAALGCDDLKKASQDIAREEPAALSRGADNRPGEGPAQAPARPTAEASARPEAPSDPAAPEIDDGAAAEGEAADANPSGKRRAVAKTPQRRRRSASAEKGDASGGAEASAEQADVAAASYKVSRLQVARGVSGREPVGVARTFAASEIEQLHVFVELTNEARAAGEIFVSFVSPSGSTSQRIKLNIGAERRWRTWATTRRVKAPGAWQVTISDAGGAVLGRSSFTVTR
ncbi:DUF2914 domain-containing protein [Chondromyces apiculatus]|uniref:DUF2914 domain-containing protein n=1 Tax=Chondromyces apiculatus TaxID=51 RepID=UPI0012DBE43D|nr:DUF2914 domain-containing protein [Chondromyces apiculatus]